MFCLLLNWAAKLTDSSELEFYGKQRSRYISIFAEHLIIYAQGKENCSSVTGL